ncbi:MAG: hypothetical protein GTN84_07340 [Hydrogenophaga sp.]|uniref:GspH/FimT family pseudopilin n=1 Tax=Hydrogenophaga sp. TaxID=1904254 RepID=UPI0016AC4114|nr:GspH/FimT family pseudopilin [Hydrogenophaga sp.]NIM40755.1 hypothetical protein [Hydrogenophaga sp.]NIN26230.1 hypothetical protein [Hydrogenophaga sp.]NIN31095.1 hypothetical protein [Hydrogenophaga sp.]NIN55138.1 hypothetical protein [Hydrogenophaga sp.]NIO51181.1 hypothetical protein [Hydrogenophaga sp.]
MTRSQGVLPNHPSVSHHARHRGATGHGLALIELLTAIALLAILLGIGIPSFTGLLQRWRTDATIESLTADVRLARSTATRTSRPVVMCPRAADGTCSAGDDWSMGWMVFSDTNGNDALDTGEPVIRERQAPTGIASMADDNRPALLTFRANGTLRKGRTSVAIRPSHAAEATASVVINAMGRVYVQAGN